MKFRLIFVFYAIGLSFLVGGVSALFLIIVNAVTHLIWEVLPAALSLGNLYPIWLGLLGGLLVGLFQLHIGDYPKTMHETLHEFQTTKTVQYEKQIWKNFVAAVIVLGFGASLGPEAALASILGGLISWIGDRLKLILAKKEELLELSVGAMLATIFRAPFMGISAPIEESIETKHPAIKWKKIALYGVSTVVGLMSFALVEGLFPKEPLFTIRIPHIQWEKEVVYLILPALILGILFGYFFQAIEHFSEWIARKIKHPLLLALLAGGAIGVFALFSSYFLFSGEHELMHFTELASGFSIGVILFISIGKAVLTNICFAFGWRGGKIFPAIFSSAAIGFVLTNLFPYTPGLILSIVTTASLTVILKQPVVIVALLLFLFPLQFFPFIFVTSFLVKKCMTSLIKKFPVLADY